MYRKYVPFLLFLFFLYGCNGNKQEEKEDVSVFVDLPQLKAEGEITAVTLYSSTSYFQYKMQPMGYEYALPLVCHFRQELDTDQANLLFRIVTA